MKTKSILIGVVTIMVLAVLMTSKNKKLQPATQPQRFLGIGDLPGGYSDSVAYGVSADGTVVVGYSNSEFGMEGFRWTPSNGMIGLGFSRAFASNTDGSCIVGYQQIAGGAEPVLWKQRGVTGLGRWPGVDSYPCGEALSISADGSVVVGSYGPLSGLNGVAFRWTLREGISVLQARAGGPLHGELRDVSADGEVGVGVLRHQSGQSEAFRWSAADGIIMLGTLPGDTQSIAHAISADGRVIVGCSEGIDSRAFLWTRETGMIPLGKLNSISRNSMARSVNADGSVIVGQCYGESGLEAFIWDAYRGIRSLHKVLLDDFAPSNSLHGWKLLAATAVSDDGSVVVGYGFNPSGNREAWLARLGRQLFNLDSAPLSVDERRPSIE